mmetsp:Transcript_11132/g.24476  ORF Transcript_11132/g.24476 Transcript_11132/m.24476 type:complete len:265 (-) Transcript_11132:358-1152(-)
MDIEHCIIDVVRNETHIHAALDPCATNAGTHEEPAARFTCSNLRNPHRWLALDVHSSVRAVGVGLETCQGELLAAGHRQRPTGRHLAQGAHDAAHARGAIGLHVGKGAAGGHGTGEPRGGGAHHLRQSLGVHRAGEVADVIAGLRTGANHGLHVNAGSSETVHGLGHVEHAKGLPEVIVCVHFGTAPELCLLLGRPHDVVSLVLARLACQLLGREELPEARRIIGAHHATQRRQLCVLVVLNPLLFCFLHGLLHHLVRLFAAAH